MTVLENLIAAAKRRARSCGRGEVSTSRETTPAARRRRAAARVSSSARDRSGLPSRVKLALPSVSTTSTALRPLRRCPSASS